MNVCYIQAFVSRCGLSQLYRRQVNLWLPELSIRCLCWRTSSDVFASTINYQSARAEEGSDRSHEDGTFLEVKPFEMSKKKITI